MSNDTAKQALVKNASEALVPVNGLEIATSAAAAQVKALVEARFVLAIKNPRNMDQVRLELLKECGRPSFALEDIEGKGNSAYYRKPVGGSNFVEGLGIRFAEVAVRCMGNMMDDAITIQETDQERIKYCFVLDLEKNNSWADTVHIIKTVERKKLKEGQQPIKTRRNSQDQIVYTVEADEDALATKEGALISKKMRTLILRMIPGDLQDECITKIKEVREKRIMEDPDAARKALADLMFKVNVTVPMMEAFIKHPFAQCTPAELIQLQGLYSSLSSGETTWIEVMENATADQQEREQGGNEAMRAKVVASQQASAPQPTQSPTPQPSTHTAAATTQPAEGAAKGAPPWMTKKTEQPTAAPTSTPELTLEQKVAAMAAQQQQQFTPAPAQSPAGGDASASPPPAQRAKPTHPKIKGVEMPEFADRVGPEDAWTQDQYNRLVTALQNIPGEHGLIETVMDWIGLPIEQVNAATIEAMIVVLNNWKTKKPQQ